MMNSLLNEEDIFLNEIYSINQMLAPLLNSYKEAGNYFERYLTQISTKELSYMVKRL